MNKLMTLKKKQIGLMNMLNIKTVAEKYEPCVLGFFIDNYP